MIVVDTSALMAVVLGDKAAKACGAVLQKESHVLIAAGTMVEASDVRATYRPCLWTLGEGANSAGLNFGDCFAYAVAKEYACPLLYVGNDFAKTDIESVL